MTTVLLDNPVRIPRHLSPSQVGRIQTCPARYLLERAYPPQTQSWKIIGTPVHEAIEDCITNGLAYEETQGVAQARIDYLLETEGPIAWSKKVPDDAKAREIVTHCVHEWWRQAHPTSDDRLPAYSAIAWPPRVEVRILTDTDPPVLMYLDNLGFLVDGNPIIVDYKTGTSNPDISQLIFYWWGLRKAGIATDRHKPSGFFHKLRTQEGTLMFFDTYPGDGLVEQWIREAASTKRNGRWEPRPNMMCSYCPVKGRCPIYGGREALRNLKVLGDAVQWQEVEE